MSTKVTINDELSVEFEDIGEGLMGDYDPDDPNDIALLRFDVSITEEAAERYEVYGESTFANDGMFVPQDTSYCTQVPVETPDSRQLELLASMALELHKAMRTGMGLKRTAEHLSWTSA